MTVIAAPQTMYNLTVETVATYLVGDGHWVVHNQDILIGLDADTLQAMGVSLVQDSSGKLVVQNTSILVGNPTAELTVGTIRGSIGNYGQSIDAVKDFARAFDATQLLIKAPEVVNPNIAKLLLNPKFLNRYGLQIVRASVTDRSRDLIPALKANKNLLAEYKVYRDAVSKGKIARLSHTSKVR